MSQKEKINLKIIVGSTRQNRFSEQPARWLYEEAKKLPDAEVELLDLRDYALPFFNEPISPAMGQGDYTDETVARWAKKIAAADAYIAVTPEYNHGYSAVLKNAFDHLYHEWNNKPIGFLSYGSVGGARSVEQLRQIAIELQMAPIRNAIYIANFWSLLDTNGQAKPGSFTSLAENAEKLFSQLNWWAKALKTAREKK
ncbi:MAG: NAD(P)H-dependent oxidoreductase [Parcubacteria group bacterium]|nr:NAD(P)H-dependent oxidoreductase [Parcubacteria group bacterium]